MNRIKILREKTGKTQDDMAKVFHINRTTYTKWEADKHKPDADTLVKLALFFNTSVDYILGITDDPAPYGQLPPELTIEELINKNPNLTEESKKALLHNFLAVETLDKIKAENEKFKEELGLDVLNPIANPEPN